MVAWEGHVLEQLVVFGTLLGALVLFVWGKWRYDLVAMMALLVVTVTGIVEAEQAFMGFANPAVVTVAAVLVISRCLINAGLVDLIGSRISHLERPTVQVAVLCSVVLVLSAFINNVGALALLLPVAIRLARKHGRSPSYLLMPLAFCSLLGGMTTLIGTPPNLIIANFRRQTEAAAPFGMFDFTPVGLGVALAGLAFIVLLGWRLTPQRTGQASREDLFHIEDYLTEVRIPPGSSAIGKMLRELLQAAKADVVVVGFVRAGRRFTAPSGFVTLRGGDVLTLEADPESLKTFIDAYKLELEADEKLGPDVLRSDEISLVEAVVSENSPLENRTAKLLNLRWRYGVNVLAVARRGQRLSGRLGDIRFRVGDILLLQIPTNAVQETLSALGCLPLAERGLRLGQPRRIALSVTLFGVAIALSATGLLTAPVAFAAAAVAMVLVRLIPLREVYQSIDWSIIVLLGAFIPVGFALETTGGAQLIAEGVLSLQERFSPAMLLGLITVVTMLLSSVINNAAAAVLLAPIGINVARGLGVSADPFLLAIAIGASCAFLTPIAHQSNTLVMGPGGYKFSDYWPMGLPLAVIVVAVAVPLLLLFWPL
jgi:di/tricarboxylate transporter